MWKNIISAGLKATRATRGQVSKATTQSLATPTATRTPFSTSPLPRIEKGQDPLDRETLNPERSETAKSGTDGEVAKHPSAFDPKNTAPESELAATEEESRQEGKTESPLNMSPANRDASAWRHEAEDGPDRNRDRAASSSRGAPKKGRGIHVKEDGTHVSYRD
ncbi:hypothetical protein LT330_004517 [Penicillium expansum]|uniref:Uncharacterized protein n=1 Tax=Penicillium expansum TaxID=27334 RepID=A0A0A2IF05_PENEN|nr:hypothetical protein PEX2_092550 [Penicillium expansum]KAK4860786.1 hypothetical protein LT330_004517 [Penicillium expansum]KGO41033.1 hypothetical protein PEXP_083960 [Penicillium expansum]KGO58900.1 hypothetical protein PEX2_092550 [Penicillium expansum]KGO72238.1 hypothetical protein PEX1_060440 [Penicillium expansum]